MPRKQTAKRTVKPPDGHRLCLIVKWKDGQIEENQMLELLDILANLSNSFVSNTDVDEVYLSANQKQLINFKRPRNAS